MGFQLPDLPQLVSDNRISEPSTLHLQKNCDKLHKFRKTCLARWFHRTSINLQTVGFQQAGIWKPQDFWDTNPCPNGICIDRLIIQKAKYKVRLKSANIFWSESNWSAKCSPFQFSMHLSTWCCLRLSKSSSLAATTWVSGDTSQNTVITNRFHVSMKSCTPSVSSSTSCRHQGVNGWFRSGCNRLNCCWMYVKKASRVGNQEAFLSWKMLSKCFLLKIGLKDLQS